MAARSFIHGNTIRANDIRQHYLRFGGKGQPLILVPGIVSPAQLWDFVGDRLGQVFDTYVVDVRGRGLSEAGDGLDYSLDAYAADIAGLAEALGLQDIILLGHSMGARIAIRTARHHPARFARIILADPPVSGPGRRPYPVPLSRVLGMLASARRGELWDATKYGSAWTEHSTRTRAEWMHTCNEVAVVTTHRNFHEEDIFADLPHIAVPSALIRAGQGGVITADDVAEIQRLAPGMAMACVENAGHMIPFEDLEGFMAALATVLGIAL
jgi:N-formylmaleamate deformylase